MQTNLFELQKILQQHGVLISFSGRFSQEIIEELGDAVKKYLETESISQTETYNVFSIFIEQTQNIKNYCGKKANSRLLDRIANSGIVAIGKTDLGHYISAGNLIEAADAAKFATQLDTIIAMDKQELKQYYKQQLKADIPPGTNSAGLGLIDMARKASRPLEYSIMKLDESVCFFTLKAFV
jgi:uncharacterized protein YqgQ